MGRIIALWQPGDLADRDELLRLSELYSLLALTRLRLRQTDPAERRLARELERWSARIGAQLEAVGFVEDAEDEEAEKE